MKRFALLLILGVVCIVTLSGLRILRKSQTVRTCRRCNVIVIAIDSLRADALPCYGYHLSTAPELCKFAGHSTVFTQAYANSSWTLPSDMSLFTSLYPVSHGMGTTMRDALSHAVPTLPELFSGNGYKTFFVSTRQPNVDPEQGFGRGFSSITYTPDDADDPETIRIWSETSNEIQRANTDHRPAFVYMHTDAVHNYSRLMYDLPNPFPLDPQYVPENTPDMHTITPGVLHAAEDVLTLSINDEPDSAETPARKEFLRRLRAASSLSQASAVFHELPQDVQTNSFVSGGEPRDPASPPPYFIDLSRHMYDESIRRFDGHLADFLTGLARKGLLRNTVVVVTAEHGELLGEGDIVGHGTKFLNPEIHVPLIVYSPTFSARRIDSLAQLIDVYPTLLELTGLPIPRHVAGISLAGVASGIPNAKGNEFVISQWSNIPDERSIITNQWHYLESSGNQGTYQELYDRIRDPHETRSVASQHADTVSHLSALLRTTLDHQPEYPPEKKPFPDWVDEEHKKQLIETGYFY